MLQYDCGMAGAVCKKINSVVCFAEEIIMKNFVFDLYGTLVDIRTDENAAKFRKKFVEKYGAVFGNVDFFSRYEEIMKSFPPLDEPDICRVFMRIAEEGGQVLDYKTAESLAANFRKLSLIKLRLYPFVYATLRGLKRRGARVFILSNAQSAFTRGETERFSLDVFCDGIELSSDFGRKKPAKEFFLYAIGKYRLELSETIYIGNDIACDIFGAKAVGLKTAYIRTKISPPCDSLEKAKTVADFTAANHARLKKLLLSLCD